MTEENKNGHMFGSSRHSSALDAEYDEDGLKGARATSHRRLPDLPDPLLNGSENPVARHSSVRSSQDTTSELYAQVEIGNITNSCMLHFFLVDKKSGIFSLLILSYYSPSEY